MPTPYTVKSGDTLSAIARKHGMTWQDIYNHPTNEAFRQKRPNPNLIQPGDVIMIPDGATGPVVPASVKIELDDNQIGQTGDIIPSTLGAPGKRHYVSPKVDSTMTLFSFWPFNQQSMSPFVTLKASDSTNFAANFEWEGATSIPGTPHKARISRLIAGHFPVKIKNKSTGSTVDELNV